MNRLEERDIVKEKNIVKEKSENSKEVNIKDSTNHQENNNNNVKLKGAKFKAKQIMKKILQTVLQTRLFVIIIATILLLKTILLYKMAIFTTKPLEFKYIYIWLLLLYAFL